MKKKTNGPNVTNTPNATNAPNANVSGVSISLDPPSMSWPICRTCDVFLCDRRPGFPARCQFDHGDGRPHRVERIAQSPEEMEDLTRKGYRTRRKRRARR
jgi:hypothetical protein